MVGSLVMMRLGVDPRVKHFLARQSLAFTPEGLVMSRQFGLA